VRLVQQQIIQDPVPGETYEVIATPSGREDDPEIGTLVFFMDLHPVTWAYRLRKVLSGKVITGHYTLAPYI
jgi:hypothetical protein